MTADPKHAAAPIELGAGHSLGEAESHGPARGSSTESAPENRRVLESLLRDEATGFQFFQAVRLLERIRTEKGRVGEFTDPTDEVARFRVPPSLAFPAAEIHAVDLPREQDDQAEITANFMGLVGPLGVMPLDYTLLVAREQREGGNALPDFINIFENRIISLFYRAWKKHRVTVAYEEGDGSSDVLTEHLFDFIGQGMKSFQDHLPIDERSLIYYSSLLLAPHRNALALEQLITDYFAVETSVEQFVGQWHALRDEDLCEVSDDSLGSNVLGAGAVVGDEVHDLHSRVRIRIGPLDREDFENFLPGRQGHSELRALTRFFGQGQYDFEVQLVLRRDRVPKLELGGDSMGQLGWLTWVHSSPFQEDADQTVLVL